MRSHQLLDKFTMSLEAKNSLISDLEQRQLELQASINDAARSGADSMKPRQEMKAVYQKLQAARADVASMEAAGRQAAARATEQVGNDLTDAAIDRIVGGAAQFGDVLAAGAPPVDFTGAPALSAAMLNLAAARARVSEAEAVHADAAAEVEELAGKAAAKRDRHSELSRQRISGEAGEGSAAEMYATHEDIGTLERMHETAKSKADALLPAVHDARNALRTSEKQVATIEHRLTAEHLAAHAKALDAALVSCLRKCQVTGARAGIGIGALAPISLELRTYVSSGVLPAPFRRA